MYQLRQILALFALTAGLTAGESAAERLVRDGDLLRFTPRYPVTGVDNPWPDDEEAAFARRATALIGHFAGQIERKTDGEREKRSYPNTIGAWLAGADLGEVVAALSAGDHEAERDHEWTAGIDLYWSFTIKGQVAKYFLFEHDLDPAYRDQMRAAFKAWTAADPRPSLETILLLDSPDAVVAGLAAAQMEAMWVDADTVRNWADQAASSKHQQMKDFAAHVGKVIGQWPAQRPATVGEWRAWWKLLADGDWMVFEEYERRANPHPHPKYGTGTGPVGGAWDPAVRGTRADARNTDNLRAMRDVAAYLFAEEVGNEAVRRLCKARIATTARAFWAIGNGEWDSPGYHAHALAPYASLYAYARDEEVRKLAKALLDYLFVCAAAKYHHGSWGGPASRDYGTRGPFGESAGTCWPYFGGPATGPEHAVTEFIFTYTSGYRPPMAALMLARKADGPYELRRSHPTYSTWLPGRGERPETHETYFATPTYSLGTLAEGHAYHRCGFRILAGGGEGPAKHVIPAVGKRASKDPVSGRVGGERAAQWRNLALYLRPGTGERFTLLAPAAVEVVSAGAATCLRVDGTYIAVIPVNLEPAGIDTKLQKGRGQQTPQLLHQFTPVANGSGPTGLAFELGDSDSHGSWADFQTAVATMAVEVEGRRVALKASDGRELAATFGDADLPRIERDGLAHDWATHDALFHGDGDAGAPALMPWKQRSLTVTCGGWRFHGELGEDGSYTWENTRLDG